MAWRTMVRLAGTVTYPSEARKNFRLSGYRIIWPLYELLDSAFPGMVHGSGLHVADGIWEKRVRGITRLQFPHADATEEER
jgi:hypothetical protein